MFAKRITKRIFYIAVFFGILFPKNSFAKNISTFSGQLDLINNNLDIVINLDKQNPITLTVKKNSAVEYSIYLKLDHYKTSILDISTNLESSLKTIKLEDSSNLIQGKIWSSYSLIDYKPADELTGTFEIKDGRLLINSLFWGRVQCEGSIDLVHPNKLDLVFKLSNIHMSDFIAFWMKKKGYDASGPVSGEIRVSGSLDRLFLKGALKSYKGHIKALTFDSLYLNAEGTYPWITVKESTVNKADGLSFMFEGEMNLADKGNFKKQIKSLNISSLVSESGSAIEWTLKSFEDREKGKTELKYLLRKDNNDEFSDKGESDMFGVERTMEF